MWCKPTCCPRLYDATHTKIMTIVVIICNWLSKSEWGSDDPILNHFSTANCRLWLHRWLSSSPRTTPCAVLFLFITQFGIAWWTAIDPHNDASHPAHVQSREGLPSSPLHNIWDVREVESKTRGRNNKTTWGIISARACPFTTKNKLWICTFFTTWLTTIAAIGRSINRQGRSEHAVGT